MGSATSSSIARGAPRPRATVASPIARTAGCPPDKQRDEPDRDGKRAEDDDERGRGPGSANQPVVIRATMKAAATAAATAP